MPPDQRKRPPTLFLGENDSTTHRLHADPPGELGADHPPDERGNHHELSSQSIRTLHHRNVGVTHPGFVRTQPGLSAAEMIQRSRLQAMGNTSEGAIAIDSDDDDDDEIEVVFAVQAAQPVSRAPRPRHSQLGSGLLSAVASQIVRDRAVPDPTVSSFSRLPAVSTQSRANGGQISRRQFSALATGRPVFVPSAPREQEKRRKPIEIIEIDTEEEFQNQENEVEVINIDDSEEEDSDDDSYEAYAQGLNANDKKRSIASDKQRKMGSTLKTDFDIAASRNLQLPYAQVPRGDSDSKLPPYARKIPHVGYASKSLILKQDPDMESSDDDEIEVWDSPSKKTHQHNFQASISQIEGTSRGQIEADEAFHGKVRSMQNLLPNGAPGIVRSNVSEGVGSFHNSVARMPAGQKTRELESTDGSHSKVNKVAARRELPGDGDDLVDTESESGRSQVLAPSFRKSGSKPYSCKEFARLWMDAEKDVGKTEILEKQRSFQKTKSTEQYGKILPKGMKRIFKKVLNLKPQHQFIDIGSGIGNITLQGCRSKGIECVGGRCDVADKFQVAFEQLANEHKELDGMTFEPGKVELKRGELQDKNLRSWIVDGTDFYFVNNFGYGGLGGSFSGVRDGCPSLDGHVAALFAMMKEGGVLVTLSPLLGALGCLSLKHANAKRQQLGLPESDNASYYEVQKHKIGKQSQIVSWSEGHGCDEPVTIYRYTLLKQPAGEAVFLCNNPDCQFAQAAIPIPAVVYDDNGDASINVCECRHTDRSRRRRRKAVYYGK